MEHFSGFQFLNMKTAGPLIYATVIFTLVKNENYIINKSSKAF